MEWADAISTLGFPIVCVLGMACFIWNIYKQSVEREEKLYCEIKECREVNNKAIDTIGKFAEKLDTIQSDVKEIKADIKAIEEAQK